VEPVASNGRLVGLPFSRPDGTGEVVLVGGAELGARAALLFKLPTADVVVAAAREGIHVVKRPDDRCVHMIEERW